MDVALLFIAATTLLAVAGYAQWRVRAHTVGSRVALLRGVLVLVGLAFAYATTASSGAKGALAVLAFLTAFGLVHVPAAIILFFKDLRHEGRS